MQLSTANYSDYFRQLTAPLPSLFPAPANTTNFPYGF
nr:MAG TPA: hypothetical protein [Caudoviricetes sp.]